MIEITPLHQDDRSAWQPLAVGYNTFYERVMPDATYDHVWRRLLEAKENETIGAAGLHRALAVLDPRSRRIVEARWLKEKDTATLHDLAAEFGVSAERIRQVEAKAMQKMKKVLQAPAERRALPAPPA